MAGRSRFAIGVPRIVIRWRPRPTAAEGFNRAEVALDSGASEEQCAPCRRTLPA